MFAERVSFSGRKRLATHGLTAHGGTRRLRAAPWLPILACLLYPAVGSAGEFDDSVYEMGELILPTERPRVVEAVSTMEEVTAEDILRAGARTLDQALKLLPGLYIRTETNGTP